MSLQNKFRSVTLYMVFTVLFLSISLGIHLLGSDIKHKYFPLLDKSKYIAPAVYKGDVRADTIYTLKHNWIEINLKSHLGILHQRYEKDYVFKISAGTDKVVEGIETPEGIFVLRSKLKKTYSKQFDSTMLINWMGFSNGVGFHALKGNSYYYNLGKRNSSHGCIRLSKDDSSIIFDRVSINTPVIVSKSGSVVSIGFIDSTESYLNLSKSELQTELTKRNKLLYDGKYYTRSYDKLLIDTKNVGQSGLSVGDVEKIPDNQIIPK